MIPPTFSLYSTLFSLLMKRIFSWYDTFMEIDEKILEQLKEVPQSPGVYLLRGAEGRILYVGKAKRLRNRLASYFRSTQTHSVKTQTLVVNTRDFEYILTTTETEALLLEANLIRQQRGRNLLWTFCQ
jgi:excinuclease ABC subunit C